VGIISGLFLFIAFYAGAITMFEVPLQRWASPPSPAMPGYSQAVALEDTDKFVAAVIAEHPEAAKRYTIHVNVTPETPARMSWT
ncbi:PepSY domain-containing protein, partial [Escherichia coli]|uniref:PepSY domain-containing protein n=1 Tax=Escherichia coli TaxID=562 RepID=UPI0028DD4640